MTEDPVAIAAIRRIIDRAGDHEAVGLLYRAPGEAEIVVALNNISSEPMTSYVVSTKSIEGAARMITGLQDLTELDESHLVLWHSHPTRAEGPSRKDMQTKLPGLRYAVVVVDDYGDLSFTEF